MAKARTKASVRDRAIAAYIKAAGIHPSQIDFLNVTKSRSKDTITVRSKVIGNPLTWSYKGGNLRRLTDSEAAGIKNVGGCISEFKDETRLPHSKFAGYAW